MKKLLLCIILIISQKVQSQNWLDNSCPTIDDKVMIGEFKAFNEQNILKIIINQAGDLEINDKERPNLTEIALKEYVLDLVINPNRSKDKADKPQKVLFQIKSFQKDSNAIQKLTNYVYDVYVYIWDLESNKKYNSTYLDLNCNERAKIFNSYPLKILSETDNRSNTKKKKKRGIGVPIFGGDASDN